MFPPVLGWVALDRELTNRHRNCAGARDRLVPKVTRAQPAFVQPSDHSRSRRLALATDFDRRSVKYIIARPLAIIWLTNPNGTAITIPRSYRYVRSVPPRIP